MSTIHRVIGLLSVFACVLVLPATGLAGSGESEQPLPPAALNVQSDRDGCGLSLEGGTTFHVTVNEVRNERVVAVPGSPTLLILWDEVQADGCTVPFYAVSPDGYEIARVAQTSYVLKLRHGDFNPAAGVPAAKAGLAADASCNLYLVQFFTQPLEVFRNQIEDLGGTVRHFIANHAHIVQMSPAVRDAVAELPFVRWVGAFHPAYRLEEFMLDNRDLGEVLFPLQRYNIQVFEAGLSQKETVAGRIETLGGIVDKVDDGKYLLVATLTPEQLFEVVTWDEVLFVDRWGPYEVDMNNARALGGADYIESVAGYTGDDVRGEVFDNGFNLTHVDFQHHPLIPHGAVGSASHGASTSGICFGDGTGNPQARGMLPTGQGIVGDYNTIGLEGPSRYQHTGELPQDPYYGVFETASVGSPRVLQYTTISADTDAALFDFDVVHCQSQSNAGDQMSRPQAWAKNIISGGGAYHYDTETMDDDCWCGGASIGPAADGRIKPDLCAFYDAILTTTSGGTQAYTYGFGGTSGATPIICGHVGLFFQMWSDGIFGNEVDPQGSVFENRSHMTTAKAMMINNAQQYPFSGLGHDHTRVHQGWGWPDIGRVYDMREKIFVIDETELLGNMESIAFMLSVPPDEPEFRATLTYADPPGVPNSSQHRINDLTLKVTTPGGTVYWGNHGLLDANYSSPGGAADTIDTVENVLILNPETGMWIVEVFADEIVEDSHVETPELDADFALVVSGVLRCSPAGIITLDQDGYSCEATAVLIVIDCDLNTNNEVIETVTVTIDSDSEPVGEEVLLTETGPATAVFDGWIGLSATNAPGVLLVADGDTVTATYIDEDNGQGGHNVEVTDTAMVDCVAPEISNVAAMPGSVTATVSFDANEPVLATVYYGLSCEELDEQVSTSQYEMSPVIELTGLLPSTRYYFAVSAEDEVSNTTYDDNGGSCYTFKTAPGPGPVYVFSLDTDPGWTTESQWAWGQPTGGGGQYGGPDPTSGYTGPNVYGYNLNGDYSNNMPEYDLTSTTLDCTGVTETSLRFWRWLGVERSLYDHAYIRISNNGTNWTTIWENPDSEIAEYAWSFKEYDISAYADDQPTVYLRWTMGTTDTAWIYCGWNIDDIELWGVVPEAVLVGDVNCDGEVDFGDINPFILAMNDPDLYEQLYPDCPFENRDINGDGVFDFNDVNPFVALLSGY